MSQLNIKIILSFIMMSFIMLILVPKANATAAFAQGKVHPSGVKAKLLNMKLYGSKNKNQLKQGKYETFSSLLSEKAQVELTQIDAYQANILWLIKLFYKCLIGGLISFMILHQILDYFATRREHKKEKH